jgi:hypothetical protein
MKVGDLVRFVCKDPRDIGIVVHIYDKHPSQYQSVDILWGDGVFTQNTEDVEVIDEVR